MAGSKRRVQTPSSAHSKLADELRTRYEEGASIRQIAEKVGRSYGFVHRTLVEAGVELRRSSTGRTKISNRKPRDAAHRLLDEVPTERVPAVVEMLRREVDASAAAPVHRRFRTVGVFDGEPDLGKRSKEIARRELGGKPSKTA